MRRYLPNVVTRGSFSFSPHGAGLCFRVHAHRAELVDREDSATQVAHSPIVHSERSAPTPVESDTRLRVKNRPTRRELDQDAKQE